MGRHRIHANPFNIRQDPGHIDGQSFKRRAPIALDIGFGPGAFVLALARAYPQWNVLGLEIRKHFVQEAQAEAEAEGLDNVQCRVGNINLHLHHLVPDQSLGFVSLNFPDPWFKKRHHKRRVVQPDWLDTLAQKMMEGALFHIMTDYEPQAVEIKEHLDLHRHFECKHFEPFALESTTGLHSEREHTHQARAEPIYRLCYRRNSQSEPKAE